MVYFTLVGWLHLITLGLHINSTNSNLKFRQPTRFRINPQDSSIFSFQDQYSRILKVPQSSRFIQAQLSLPLDHLIFLVLRGLWSFVELTRPPYRSSSVKTLDRVFKRSIERSNADRVFKRSIAL
ncbi:hypothetical protein PGT21_014898 [Puccinia graminis f. sp. tritici]|uniref:Uncharacterized protein n=1 Tax=Puccinia graminis f. sp. tritici TaxID=56615 RepID=A0A5B0PXP8_PUCGR|nr:hypothetical protein PGT21_014898 [Puccinia graminis f. sp. tritici]